MTKAMVVLSGGQDSTTCLFWAKKHFDEVHAVTFDYNQKHNREIEAAKKIAQMAGVASHEVVELGPILKGRSFLTNSDTEIETFENFEQMSRKNASKEDKLDSSFVPMRNVLFLTVAANRAYTVDASALVTGVTAADFVEYGDFSWEWLGGFVDAEGCFSVVNGNGWRLSISQNDPELLQRIGNWIKNQIDDFTFSIHQRKDSEETELYIGMKSSMNIMKFLSPHLHSSHRRSQAVKVGVPKLEEEHQLTDAYITGFWEGDGSCSSQIVPTRLNREGKSDTVTAQFKFEFFQKDPSVLEKISEYLNKGTVYQRNTQNRIWVLTISDGPQSAKLLRRMKPHLNVLKSFEKISKWRHNCDLPFGSFNPPYPDCTPDFIWSMQKSLDEALISPYSNRIEIITPVMFLTKAQSIRLSQRLPGCMEALAYSHTAYSGEFPPKTQDHATVLRAEGFRQAGVPDPLIVRAHKETGFPLPNTPNYDSIKQELGEIV